MSKLQGKVAVVTGGNSGIGLATAKEFAREGAQVIITGRDVSTLESAGKEIGAALAIQADVRSLTDLDRLFSTVKAQFGGIDVLFVNAGIAKLAPLHTVTEDEFDTTMDINFKGAFFTVQKALPVLNDEASIILNGSVNAHVGFPGTSVYSASKAALHSLARTLSTELSDRKIRVNTLTIGPVNTPLWSKVELPAEALQGFAQTVQGRLTIKRFADPVEIGKAAVFLASADSSFVVGSEVATDGGILINAL
jgi:NAD(P)-dependent dehydrogenase (short-subunit alcohol dehydrogenase family)